MMERALRGRYAVGYFESWNLESLQGVVDAAEQAQAPVILGFNGDFLTDPRRSAEERLELYGALARAAAEGAIVPCGVFFNECARDAATTQAVTAGFNLVMPVAGESSPAEYERRTTAICTYAHAHGVAVQAELGELPSGVTGIVGPVLNRSHSGMTDPEQAADFVAATGVDLLAVSVGNVHILVDGRRTLDLEHLARIRQQVAAPLVLHGGTGIERSSLRAAIGRGVALVQFGTGLKQRYLAALRKALATDERNPHELLGMGGPRDVLCAGRCAVCEAVLEELEILGCCGKA
jgi:fructose/tagatose bisphosphate aldolase